MRCNVDGFERGVRIAAGALLLGWAAFGESELRSWGLLGLWPLWTGLVRWCPAYLPFGLSTCHDGTTGRGARRSGSLPDD